MVILAIVLHCQSLFFIIMNMTLVYSIILIMTLFYSLIFSIILFLVYYAYILCLVRSEFYPCLGSYKVYPIMACPLVPWVNDRYCVGVVPIPYLSVIVPYIPEHEVDHESDSPIESSVVLLPFIGQAEKYYYGEVITLFLIFLSNTHYTGMNLLSSYDCHV